MLSGLTWLAGIDAGQAAARQCGAGIERFTILHFSPPHETR